MQSRQHFNEEPGVDGELSVTFDLIGGAVQARGTGIWSPPQVKAYFEDWRHVVKAVHANGLAVSAFVDMGEGLAQSDEVAGIIATMTRNIYRPGDAVAMLVSNSLAKNQMRRTLDARYHEYFISRSAAQTWLKGRAVRGPAAPPAVPTARFGRGL